MPNPVFQSVTVAKRDLYAKVKELITTAGWTNVSSNPATDYDVFTSSGEAGDKSLVFQLRDFSKSGTAAANSFTTVAGGLALALRFPNSYTPGATGVAGTFGRSATTWLSLYIINIATGVTLDTEFTITYHCNRNRLIFFFESPAAINIKPNMFYIGLPNDNYCAEPGAKGMLYASNVTFAAGGVSLVRAADHPGEYAAATDLVNYNVYCTLAPKNPNSAGKFHISDLYYGTTAIGFRGRLDSVFALPITGLAHGDMITIGAETYKVFSMYINNDNSFENTYIHNAFPTAYLAVRIS